MFNFGCEDKKTLQKKLKNKKFALLSNYASITSKYEYIWNYLNELFPNQFVKILSPQHGLMGTEQANMIESYNDVHLKLNIPIISLYSDKRQPTDEDLQGIDILLIDIQDVGCKVYTYMYTMALAMETAGRVGIDVVLLDRPNPIGADCVYGNINKLKSFVGMYPIPMQHGMTIGELALLFTSEFKLSCNVEIIKMNNYKRNDRANDQKWPWIAPSPNLPTPNSTIVYPGAVILEGTNISEGRGTTQPFEILGAPYIDDKFYKEIMQNKFEGAILREIKFKPTFDKYKDQICNGIFVHVINKKFNSYLTYLELVKILLKLYPNDFKWKEPPYEYDYENLPFDILTGDIKIRKMLEENKNKKEIDEFCQESSEKYKQTYENSILY